MHFFVPLLEVSSAKCKFKGIFCLYFLSICYTKLVFMEQIISVVLFLFILQFIMKVSGGIVLFWLDTNDFGCLDKRS